MSLAITLNNALSGLRINQSQLATISQNIANVGNKDYSRKIVDQSTNVLEGVGAGVSVVDISRKIDVYLQSAMQRQTSAVGKASLTAEYAARLQIMLGKPGAADSLDVSVTDFFNALQALADGTEKSSYKLNVVNSGASLARRISTLVSDTQELRMQADQDIAASVATVNQKVVDLYQMNTAISNAYMLRRPTSELLDKRDALIRGIAEHIDVNPYFRSDGTVQLYTAGGGTLVDENYGELDYQAAASPEVFESGARLSELKLYRVGHDGARIGSPAVLVTGGDSSEVTTTVTSGKIRAAIDVRDTKLPTFLDQLDMFASRVRDQVNAVHNRGSAYPGSATLTGSRPVAAGDYSLWTGKVRIALVDANGQPLESPYGDEDSGMRPLTIDLEALDSKDGYGEGQPTVAAIMQEINQHFGQPQNRFSLGNLNNIQMSSLNTRLPAARFDFDFDLENIASDGSRFFVTNTVVRDDTGADITSVSDTIPAIALDSTSTYTTTSGSAAVVIAAAGHGLSEGDMVFLPAPGSAINGISSATLGGYFIVSNVTDDTFEITAATTATSTGSQNVASLEAKSVYQTVDAGEKKRTGSEGSFRADLSGNLTSDYYEISVTFGVVDEDDNVSTATVTYRIQNDANGIYAKRYGATSAIGGTLTLPRSSTRAYMTATLVDESGDELPTANGEYFADQPGYLKLTSGDSDYYIAIDSLGSSEGGRPNEAPQVEGSGRGFSHYFELNNFFNSNIPVSTGDTVAGSASGFSVASRLLANSGLVATGGLVQTNPPADPDTAPFYTYERAVGDNSIAHQLGALANALVAFDAAGGLSSSNQTLNGYAGEIVGFISEDANDLESATKSASIIMSGYEERKSSIVGVNLDEELGNTIIYQNAYAASARLITVTDELFQTLLQSFG